MISLNMSPDQNPERALNEIDTRMSFEERQEFDSLRTDPAILRRIPENHFLTGKFKSNAFYDEATNHWGCYPTSSRFNHSCQPNTVAVHFEGDMLFVATENIQQGKELTFVYYKSLQYMTTDERDVVLRKEFGGMGCFCDLCTLPAEERYVSDLRRFLMRRLLTMLTGTDLKDMPAVTADIEETRSLERIVWQCILVAKLAAAEKVYAGPLLYAVYMYAVRAYIKRAYTEGWNVVPRKDVQCITEWLDQAENAMVSFTMNDYPKDQAHVQCNEFLKRLCKAHRSLPRLEGLKLSVDFQNPLKLIMG